MNSPGILFAGFTLVLLAGCATTATAPTPSPDTKLATASAPPPDKTSPPHTIKAPGPPYCTHGFKDPDGPIACIDDSDPYHPKVDPDMIFANRTKKDKTTEQVEIRWQMAYGHPDLKVQFKHDGNNCAQPINCLGGNCTTRTTPQEPKQDETCYYKIIYKGAVVVDPGVNVGSCCP